MKCTLFLQGFVAKPHDCTFFATRNTFRPDLFLLSFLRSMYSSMSMRLGFPTRYIIFGASYDCLLHQNQKIHKSNLSPFKYQAWNKHTLVESSLTSVSIVLRSIQPQFNMFKNKQKWIHKIKYLGYSSAYSWVYSNLTYCKIQTGGLLKNLPKVICISTHAQPWHCSSIKLWMSWHELVLFCFSAGFFKKR